MAFTKVAPAGIGSTPGDGYRIGDSFLHSTGVEITNINATGIVTAASLDISGAIDFDGHTELDNVNISGVSTFAGNIDANGDLDVDGHTNLDNVSVAGVSTFSGIVAAGVGSTAVSLANGKMLTFGSDHELEMFHDGSQSYIKQRYHAYPSALNIISENSQLNLMSGSGGNVHGGYENAITCHNNGHVKLYYSGTLALQTEGYGASVNGSLLINMGQLRLQDEIRHDGDSDTKIRFPANDTISMETGGGERLRINSAGQIITNGSSSNNPFPTRSATFQPPSGQTNCYISIVAGNTTSVSGLTFGDGADNNAANYAGMFEYRHNVDTLAYMQNGSDRLRIDSSGQITNAGIATSFVTTMFAANFAKLDIRGTNIANSNHYILSYGEGHANDHEFHMVNTLGDLVFRTGSSSPTERLRITTTGGLESYSASDANPNFKFRSDDTNWHGYLNQTVHGATISTILSCGGTWTVDGTTYAATKDYNGSFGTAALIVHNQYNSTATGGELVFVTKANGSSTTDGAVTERFRIKSGGEAHFYGNQTNAPEGDFGFRWDRNQPVNLQITNTNNTSVNAGARITMKANIGTLTGSYYNNGGFYLINSANGYFNYYSNSVLRININTNGDVFLNPDDANGIPTTNGAVGRRFGVKSTANNIIIGETTQTGNGYGLHIESRQTGRSGNARIAQIGLKNDASGNGQISLFTAASGADVSERMSITSDGTVNCLGTTALKVPTGTTAQRPTGTTGMLRYNTTTEELEAYGSNNYWFNVKDGKFQGEGDIGTASNPAYSGKQLKDLGRSSGNYYIKPQGYSGSAIEAYVDMTTNGGGWVLVAAFPRYHSGLTMSGNTSGLNESSVKNYATTVPSNGNTAFYNKNFINYLFHQNADGDPYSTYSIAGVHGRSGNGYILWEVRANSSNRLSTIDAFKTIYKTNEANNKFDVRYYQNTSSNTLNNYVGRDPSNFNSYANYTYGRAGTSDNANNYHYLIDDIAGGYQWAFRENSDDNPGNYNGYDLSNIFIR